MERDQDRYRRALIELIAAAYRALDTWEEGNLAGRATALGKIAHDWDGALGLGVAQRTDEPDTEDGEEDANDE